LEIGHNSNAKVGIALVATGAQIYPYVQDNIYRRAIGIGREWADAYIASVRNAMTIIYISNANYITQVLFLFLYQKEYCFCDRFTKQYGHPYIADPICCMLS